MRNQVVVIYKSKTGFSKKYAQMIAEELGCEITAYKNANAAMLSEYDTVIFISRVHAGRIDSYKEAKEMFEKSSAKQLLLAVTGATPNGAEEVIREFWSQNLTKEELENIPHFYLQGGLCYEKMPLGDKLMMKVFAAMMKKKKDKNEYEKSFENAISSSYDISSKEYIVPLVDYLRTKSVKEK